MAVEFRRASFAGRLLEQNPGLVFGGQKVLSAANASEVSSRRSRGTEKSFYRDSGAVSNSPGFKLIGLPGG
jgi:hypothetical protein